MKVKILISLLLLGGTGLSAQTILQEFISIGAPSDVIDLDLPKPSSKGSTIIAMPGPLSPGVNVASITDNAPAGGNSYRKVPGASSVFAGRSLDIWYCERCNPEVTELKFHMSSFSKGSINTVLEISDLASASPLDGSGVNVSEGAATNGGLKVGPSISTKEKDFIVARYSSTTPYPTGVTPAEWTYKTSYVYMQNAAPGTYQPTLTGGNTSGGFAMSVAAFKVGDAVASEKPVARYGLGERHFPY